MNRLAAVKGGAKKGFTFSREVSAALRQYVERQLLAQHDASTAPLLQRMVDEKFDQLETWLRPAVWGGATYSTTAALLLLELMCGKTIDPKQARDHFELIRGRAWKIVRRDPGSANLATARNEE